MSCALAGAQLYGGAAMTEKAANFCAITTCAVVVALLVGGIIVVALYFSQIKRVYNTVQTVEDYVDRLKSEGTIDKIMFMTNEAANGVAIIEQKLDQLIPKTPVTASAVHSASPSMRLESSHGHGHGRFNNVASSYW